MTDPGIDVPLDEDETRAFLGGVEVSPTSPSFPAASVLVTGAGGSIGRALTLHLARRGHRIVALDRAERGLFQLHTMLLEEGLGDHVDLLVGDVRDRVLTRTALQRSEVSHVIHAAAHKHVAFMEGAASECRRNNVEGTRDLFLACRAAGVRRFVFLSTDKAVEPTSTMGRAKREAERLLRNLDRAGAPTTVCVRLPNVLGSDGSVVQVFRRQALRGDPLTVTDPDATRLFIGMERAVRIITAAAAGDDRGILVPADAVTVSIRELARRAAALWSSSTAHPLVFTGLGSGERRHEKLVGSDEVFGPPDLNGLRLATWQVGVADAH